MIAARIVAVISAVFMVSAFTLATLLPPELPLSQGIAMLSHDWLVAFQEAVRTRVSEWAWTNLAVPLLVRPVWLVPVALGLVTAGVAVTLSSRAGSASSRRRRS